MKSILISGGTGLIGSKLIESLNKSKYKIYVLTRKRSFTADNWLKPYLYNIIMCNYLYYTSIYNNVDN